MIRRTAPALALLLAASSATADPSSTPAGIAKQCDSYGYVDIDELTTDDTLAVLFDEDTDIRDDMVSAYGASAGSPDVTSIRIVGETATMLGVATLADSKGPTLLLTHTEGPGGGGDLVLSDGEEKLAISDQEGAFFSLVEDGDDMIVLVETYDVDGAVDAMKFAWSGGACGEKETCSYRWIVEDGEVEDESTQVSDSEVSLSVSNGGGSLQVVKAVKSLTGLGL